jgi:hypothetical protein
MGIFGKIMGAIFGSHAEAATPSGGTSSTATGGAPPTSSTSGTAKATPMGAGGASPGPGTVDVAAILDKAVAGKSEKLAWKTSIVDLMKALDIDSSLTARKDLAKELGYTGDTSDSATMNIWLHKKMMEELAANGGKLPADIKKS